MTTAEWKALGIFALVVYALSFFSPEGALFLVLAVGLAAFVNRWTKNQAGGTTPAPPPTGTGTRPQQTGM